MSPQHPRRTVRAGIRSCRDGTQAPPAAEDVGHHGLSHPVGDSGNAEHSAAATVWLRDLHRAHRGRKVGARRHPVPDLVQVPLEIPLEVLDTLPVHSRGTSIRPDFLPRLLDFPLRNIERLDLRLQLAHPTPPGAPPVDVINSVTSDPAPSLRPHYKGLTTTTGRSAGRTRIGTRPLTVAAARGTPSRPHSAGQYQDLPSPVPYGSRSPDSRRLHAGHHLANGRAPARLIPELRSHTGFDVVWFPFDTSAAIHLRSSSRTPPDASYDAFSSSLTTTVFNQRSMRRFEASPAGRLRRAIPFIIRTAPLQKLFLQSTSSQCSGHKTWGNRLRAGRGGAVRRSSAPFASVQVRRVLHICSTSTGQRSHVLTI